MEKGVNHYSAQVQGVVVVLRTHCEQQLPALARSTGFVHHPKNISHTFHPYHTLPIKASTRGHSKIALFSAIYLATVCTP